MSTLNKSTIILVAARLKSSRLKKKVLRTIKGKELLFHLIDRLKIIKNSDDIIICTSINPQDDPIQDFCYKNSTKCFRGSENDVMGRFINAIDHYNLSPDNIVRITGDNCLVAFESIDSGIKKHNYKNADVTILKDLPIGMGCEIVNYNYFKKLYHKVEDPSSSEYMTWMLDRSDICKVENVMAPEKLRRPKYRLTCDTKEDFILLDKIYEKLYNGKPISSEVVINLLDSEKELAKINQNIKQITFDDVKNHINVNIK